MEGVNDARPAGDDAKPAASSVWTDDEFEAYLRGELITHPLASQYPDLFSTAPSLIRKWRERYHGNPALWKRLFAKDRVLKEFVEAAPFVDAIQRLVVGSELQEGEKFTIVDLACGRGYLSMLLSELLPPAKVERLVLVDKGWAMHNLQPTSDHISSSHIYGSYYETWPIRLNTSKVNLKKGKEIKNMEKRLFNDKGPVILVAVHLCGTLSLRAVDLFNRNPEVRFFCLKPCCLPGMVHAKRDEVFCLGNHSFDSKVGASACPHRISLCPSRPYVSIHSPYFPILDASRCACPAGGSKTCGRARRERPRRRTSNDGRTISSWGWTRAARRR